MTRLPSRSGMTLIEIIIAVGVASLVFTAAVSVYLVVSRSLHRPLEQRRETAYAVLESLRHDLIACAQSESTNMAACEVSCPAHGTNEPGRSTVAFTVGRIPGQEEEFTHFETARIRYFLVASTDTPGLMLMRETMTLWGAEAMADAVSNAVMEGVTGFEVSALADGNWTNSWKSSARTLFPGAVRVRLDWTAGATSETARVELFIPVGNPIAAMRRAAEGHAPVPP